jgi:hypothetical protein
MAVKISESPAELVLQVLEAYPNCLFSVREIISEVYQKTGYNLDPQTVRDNLHRLMLIHPNVFSKLSRTELKKVPVFKFTLIKAKK